MYSAIVHRRKIAVQQPSVHIKRVRHLYSTKPDTMSDSEIAFVNKPINFEDQIVTAFGLSSGLYFIAAGVIFYAGLSGWGSAENDQGGFLNHAIMMLIGSFLLGVSATWSADCGLFHSPGSNSSCFIRHFSSKPLHSTSFMTRQCCTGSPYKRPQSTFILFGCRYLD